MSNNSPGIRDQNLAIQPSSSILSPDKGDLIVSRENLEAAPDQLRDYLRQGLFDVVHNHRKPWFDRHRVLLEAITLNDHSTDHVDQVTYMALQLGRAFPHKISPQQLEAVVVGGMVHDAAFIHAADAWGSNTIDALDRGDYVPKNGQNTEKFRDSVYDLLTGLDYLERNQLQAAIDHWKYSPPPSHPDFGKKELDPHTHLGMAQLHTWLESSPSFGRAVSHWGDEQRRTAEFTVLHHSNGSDYDPAMVDPAVKLVRTADKVHNTKLRSEHLLRESTLTDSRNVHQYVPAAIDGMSMYVNHRIKKVVLNYFVNPQNVESKMRQWDPTFQYDRDRFLDEHRKAYGTKSLPYAAEGISSLFAEGENLHDPDARLVTRFEFADGESFEEEYASYYTK